MEVENVYTGEHGDFYSNSGNIDFFLADTVNYNLFNSDLSFNAYHIQERSTFGNASFAIPDEGRYYAVLSNGFSQDSTKIVNITIKIISGVEVEITAPANNSEFDQGETVGDPLHRGRLLRIRASGRGTSRCC